MFHVIIDRIWQSNATIFKFVCPFFFGSRRRRGKEAAIAAAAAKKVSKILNKLMHLGEKVFLCDDAVFDLVLAALDGNNVIKEYFKNRLACPNKISPTLCFVLLQRNI